MAFCKKKASRQMNAPKLVNRTVKSFVRPLPESSTSFFFFWLLKIEQIMDQVLGNSTAFFFVAVPC